MIRALQITALLIAGTMQAACTNTTVTEPSEIVFPDSGVSYRSHMDPFLTLSCGQCHGNVNAAGGIVLTTYDGLLFSRPNMVVPEKPDESLLIQVLEGIIGHPVGNVHLVPENHVTGTRTWILEGAQNN